MVSLYKVREQKRLSARRRRGLLTEKEREERLRKRREYYKSNIEFNREKGRESSKRRRERDPQGINKYKRELRARNLEKAHIKEKEIRDSKTAEQLKVFNSYIRQYKKQRRVRDVGFRITESLRARVRNTLGGKNKSVRTLELIGCSVEELKQHIESLFLEGMDWGNYGEWHIDHIRPCASFDLEDKEQQKLCFNWRNLQPLWAIDNIIKGAKWYNGAF